MTPRSSICTRLRSLMKVMTTHPEPDQGEGHTVKTVTFLIIWCSFRAPRSVVCSPLRYSSQLTTSYMTTETSVSLMHSSFNKVQVLKVHTVLSFITRHLYGISVEQQFIKVKVALK